MSLHESIVIIGMLVGSVLGLIGLFKPFLGLLVLMAIHFVQPGELVPELAPFRLELVYGVLLLLSFAFSRGLSLGPRLLSNRILMGAILLLGVATLTVPFAVWRGGALETTIQMTKLVILMFFISSLTDSPRRLRHVLWIVVGLLVWFAGTGFGSYMRGEFYLEGGQLQRAQGLSSVAGNPNELAGMLLALLPFLIALYQSSRTMVLKILLLGCAGLTLITMVITGSRTTMLALLAVALYYVLRSRHKLAGLAMVAALAASTWLLMPQQHRDRYLTIMDYAQGGELDSSNQLRLAVWKAGWRMFLDHPIIGVGAGQFPTAYGLIYSGRPHGGWFNPHNLLLQIVCEMGIIGLIVFGYFLSQIVKAIRSGLRLKGDATVALNYYVAVSCSALLVGLIAVSVTGHTLYRPYWYLLGGLVAANRSIADAMLGSQSRAVPEPRGGEGRERATGFAPAAVHLKARS